MSGEQRIPVVEGLFAETADGPRLLGSTCRGCGTPYFPKSPVCHHPDCPGSRMEDTAFGPRGRLWSCAVQNYPPPPPARYDAPYRPYAVGVVDLDEGLRVLGRLCADDPQGLPPGSEVELVLGPLCRDEQGAELVTWMFRARAARGRGGGEARGR